MHIGNSALLFFAAVLGGALNSVAGGGSFIGFPALLVAGIPPIQANATNTVALWPGSLASAGAFRQELSAHHDRLFWPFIVTSIVGGVTGAVLLLRTPQATFTKMIPWLLLLATVIFTFGGQITRRMRQQQGKPEGHLLSTPVVLGLQLLTAIYGGFFGAGIGILMLATLAVTGMENIHEMNAYKNILATCINGVAVVAFIVARVVVWPQAVLMIVGAILGGYGTASFVRRLDPKYVRAFVIVVACAMTAYFFHKY